MVVTLKAFDFCIVRVDIYVTIFIGEGVNLVTRLVSLISYYQNCIIISRNLRKFAITYMYQL